MALRPTTADDTARRVRARVVSERPQETSTGTDFDLQFGGGPSTESQPPLWRESSFSDWSVQLGEKTYSLHIVLLARASTFFEGHASMKASADAEGGQAGMPRSSNLTEVLPSSCHAAFETALDFIYSEQKDSFEVPTSEAVLLLKIAEVLGMRRLFEATACKIKGALSEAAPLFLQQHNSFHIPGTDEGAAMRTLVEKAKAMLIERFEPFFDSEETCEAMLKLPCADLAEILEAQELRVSDEDVVCKFVLRHMRGNFGGEDTQSASPGASQGDVLLLWKKVRWAHVSCEVMSIALAEKEALQLPEVCLSALQALSNQRDFRANTASTARKQILPPGILPPGSLDVDFTFLYRAGKFKRGEELRSQPKRMGDLVVCLLLFPAGTMADGGKDCVSVFLEAVPQPGWPENWTFPGVKMAVSFLRWQGGNDRSYEDTWTCKATSIDHGWHNFLPLQEVDNYTSPDGYLCIRGSVRRDAKLFLP